MTIIFHFKEAIMTSLQAEILEYYNLPIRNWVTIARLVGCSASFVHATVAKRHKMKAGVTEKVEAICPTCRIRHMVAMDYADIVTPRIYCARCRPAAMRFHGDVYSIGYGDLREMT
jgi:hypothetical protein